MRNPHDRQRFTREPSAFGSDATAASASVHRNAKRVWGTALFAVLACASMPAQTVTATIGAGYGPIAIAVNPATNRIYAANSIGNNVAAIDGATNTFTLLADSSAVYPCAVAVNPLTNRIYVVNKTSNNVTVINGARQGVIATVRAGTHPDALAVNPVTDRIYVANHDSDNVTVIDGASNAVIATVNAGTNPQAVAVNPATDKIYVANNGSGFVTVIDGKTNVPPM